MSLKLVPFKETKGFQAKTVTYGRLAFFFVDFGASVSELFVDFFLLLIGLFRFLAQMYGLGFALLHVPR